MILIGFRLRHPIDSPLLGPVKTYFAAIRARDIFKDMSKKGINWLDDSGALQPKYHPKCGKIGMWETATEEEGGPRKALSRLRFRLQMSMDEEYAAVMLRLHPKNEIFKFVGPLSIRYIELPQRIKFLKRGKNSVIRKSIGAIR